MEKSKKSSVLCFKNDVKKMKGKGEKASKEKARKKCTERKQAWRG